MSFFRSERMSLCHLILPYESAFDCMVELGYLGKVQFIEDLYRTGNYAPSLMYTGELERCSEAAHTMTYLKEQLTKVGLKEKFNPDVDKLTPVQSDLTRIEDKLQSIDLELYDVQRYWDMMEARQTMLTEKQQVMITADDFLSSGRGSEELMALSDSSIGLARDAKSAKSSEQTEAMSRLIFISGSLPIERFHAFEVMIWRVSRGNALVERGEFAMPAEEGKKKGHPTFNKASFLIIFFGQVLREKIIKVCHGFHATLYTCPHDAKERRDMLEDIATELFDLDEILRETYSHKRRILTATTKELYNYRITIKKMQQAYAQLNRLSRVKELRESVYFQSLIWVPTDQLSNVRIALRRGAEREARGGDMILTPLLTEQVKPHGVMEPTYFRTNKFTRGFQNLIDSYGMASYQELNPAPYTIITFPFLFAVMFGDMGHGLLMAIFAYVIIRYEDKIIRSQRRAEKLNEIGNILFAGRYIILLMGMFSIYTGFIYNDVFSKSLNLFGSQWKLSVSYDEIKDVKHLQLDPSNADIYQGAPYIIGLDPVWDASGENAIIQLNSVKMKTAIILGVTQMLFGLSLSAWNAIYFHSMIDLLLVVIPQMVFLMCLFLYLVFLIFFKWANYGGLIEAPYNSACAPSILITFIDMVLMKNSDEKIPPECNKVMFTGQNGLQKFLVIMAVLSVPVLLCGKPIHFILQHRKITKIEDIDRQVEMRRDTLVSLRKSLIYNIEPSESIISQKKKKKLVQADAGLKEEQPPPQLPEEEEKLSEIWIHQGIHTIESVLGSVSHTASYLRLWALSLAHDQLSSVLWSMVLRVGLHMNKGYISSFVLFVTFSCWAVLTIAILVVMEGLSAFLHTLRLHWVEFQSKFYSGSGEAFIPFKYEKSTAMD